MGLRKMTGVEAFLQDELKKVKYRIQILNMMEDKLRDMKALAERVVKNELEQEEIARIQFCVNELVNEINALDKIEGTEVLH